jgi:acetoin:2,6-dichlorophenolindophenol oxidoreductase subunit alpha
MLNNAGPTDGELIEIFRKASLIMQTDEQIRKLLKSGNLRANYYSPRGQEIVSAAMAANLRPDDYAVTIYRGLHDHLAKGVPLKALLAEYFGRADGSCKGKGGCMHITHPAAGVMVTTGIVGSGMPIANGLALASQVRGDGRVTVTNFGDGATNIGAFGESLNLASVWKLPVIFLCQNNLYAEHTALELGTAGQIARRADGYDMPGVLVNGNDPVAMYIAAREAVERARNGDGPTLIEARTFRFHGHNFGDPGFYIPKDIYEQAVADDPVPKLRARLIAESLLSEAAVIAMEAEIATEIAEAVAFAQASPMPDPSEVMIDIYAEKVEFA